MSFASIPGSPPDSWPGGERTSKGAVRGMAVQAVPRQSGLCFNAMAVLKLDEKEIWAALWAALFT